MGQRMPTGQAPAQAPAQGQPAQGGGGGDVMQLIEGVNQGLVTIAALVNQQAPQLGERIGPVVAEFQQIMKEMIGGGGGGGGGAQQGGPQPMEAGSPQENQQMRG
jgi:hypothetical protein